MGGRIRTLEYCACGGMYRHIMDEVSGDQADLRCDCGRRPRYIYVDGRAFGIGKVYKDNRGRKFDSFLAAKRYLEEVRNQADNRTLDVTRYATKQRVEYLVETEARKWLDMVERKRSMSYSQSCRNIMAKYALPRIGSMDVRDVRRKHLEEIASGMEWAGRAPASVRLAMDILGAFFNRLYDLEVLDKPVRVPTVEVPFRERAWINREGQERVLSRIPDRHRLIFELLISTGIRPGEACALRVRHLQDGEILLEQALDARGVVKATKAGKKRYVTIPLPLFERLTSHSRAKFGQEFLFLNRMGLPYRTKGLWTIWRKAAREAKLPISLYQGTRHSRASQIRRRREEEMYREVAGELGNTPSVAREYARDRREEMSVERPTSRMDTRNDLKTEG